MFPLAGSSRNVETMYLSRGARQTVYAASAAVMVAALALTGAVAGGSASAYPIASSVASPSLSAPSASTPSASTPSPGTPAAVPPISLLTKQMTTVLGQPLAYPTQLPAEVSSSIITLLPGQQTGWHRHDAPMYAYILSGTVTVTYDGDVTKTYRKGQAIMEAVGTRHNGVNKGEEPVRILVVNLGAQGVANSVKL